MIKVIGDIEIEQQYDWWFCLQHVWQTIQVPQNAHSTQPGCPVHIEGYFPCSLCDTTFRTKKHLAHHVFNKHKEKESMQCNFKSDDIQCGYETTSTSNFNAHRDTQKSRAKTIQISQKLLSVCSEKTHGYLISVRKMQTESAAVKQRLLVEHQNSVHLW